MENYAVHFPQASSSILEAQEAPGTALQEGGAGSCTASLLGLLLSGLGPITLAKTNNHKHLTGIHISDCLTLGSVQNHRRTDGLFSACIFSLLANDLTQTQSSITQNNTHSTKPRRCLLSSPECLCKNNSGLQIFLMLCSWQAKGSCKYLAQIPCLENTRNLAQCFYRHLNTKFFSLKVFMDQSPQKNQLNSFLPKITLQLIPHRTSSPAFTSAPLDTRSIPGFCVEQSVSKTQAEISPASLPQSSS